MKNKRAFFTTKWLTCTAVACALVVATSVIPPVPIGAANVYWCDGAIFLAAYLTDPLSAFIASGIGAAIYDFCIGHVHMAVASLLIHGLQAAATSALLHYVFSLLPKKGEPVWAFVSSLIGAAIVIGGYFLTYWLVFPLVTGDIKYGWAYAAARVVRNVLQEVIGIAIAMILCYATTLKRQLEKSNLLPDFKKEMLGKKKPCEEKEKE